MSEQQSLKKQNIEQILSNANVWRPYANQEMIFKFIDKVQGETTFIIDPWTQRWIIAKEPVMFFLKLADGYHSLTDIAKIINSGLKFELNVEDIAIIAIDTLTSGMIFNNKSEHQEFGFPVYNKCEPIGVHLEITNACNLKCAHCYVSAGKKLPNELTLEEIYKTVDMLPPFSNKQISISGGEPALRKDCINIVEYCAVKCGHNVDLYTNAVNFPQMLIDRIVEINKQERCGKVKIQVSLEGATPSTHNLVRGKGSFEATIQTLEEFSKVGLNRSTVLFVCMTKNNIHEVDQLIKLAEDIDVAMLVFSQWQKQGYASDTPWESIAPKTEEWVSLGEKLLKYSNSRLSVHGNFYGDLNNNLLGRFSLDGPFFPKHLYFYNSFPRITPQGDVLADQLWVDSDWFLGNIRDVRLDECFDSPKFYDQLDQMRQRTENIEECQTCEWQALCKSGSPGHTYAEYGHMNEKDLFCESRKYWFNRFVEHKVDKFLNEEQNARV
jgi:radical SAM protein with 4Fe4S-binding SPASM domain